MKHELPNEINEFFDTWRYHTPNVPHVEDKTALNIRRSLGYLPLKLPFSMPHTEMLNEARALKEFYVYHRSTGHHKGWRSLVLHGLSSVHSQGYEHYGYKEGDTIPYDWTDISKFCPISTEFFRDTFGYDSYDRIRFMLLEPGGYILPHEDVEWKTLSPINIALNNPIGCDFVMKEWGTLPFTSGAANMIAVGYEHAVFNDSDEDRYHIIVHGRMGQDWPQIIKDSYTSMIGDR